MKTISLINYINSLPPKTQQDSVLSKVLHINFVVSLFYDSVSVFVGLDQFVLSS